MIQGNTPESKPVKIKSVCVECNLTAANEC